MRKIHKIWIQSIGILTFLFLLNSCDNTEAYYDELLDLPQVDLSSRYAYGSAYNVDDTLWMYGRFQQPQNKLSINVGGIPAEIAKNYKVFDSSSSDSLDRIGIVITEKMGIGKRRPVVLTSGTHRIDCPEIDIRLGLNPYAFPDDSIELVQYFKAPNVAVFAQCASGTGNLFYYNSTDGSFYCVKNGAALPILTNADLKASFGASSFMIANMYCAAVDAAEKNLYFSTRLLVNGQIGFQLIRCNLETKAIEVLNDKPTKTATLSGTYTDGTAVGALNMVFSALYPDTEGNIYAVVAQNMSGNTATTNAGALLIGTDNKIKCLYTLNNNTNLQTPNKGYDRAIFLPDEQRVLLYNFGPIMEYSLPSMQELTEVSSSTVDNAPFIGVFGDVKLPDITAPYHSISLGNEKVLTYVEGSFSIPMNIYVTDFGGLRVISYAKDFSIGTWTPQKLLNYDAGGQLYFVTSNGTILKTQKVTK